VRQHLAERKRKEREKRLTLMIKPEEGEGRGDGAPSGGMENRWRQPTTTQRQEGLFLSPHPERILVSSGRSFMPSALVYAGQRADPPRRWSMW
jgi:hypothetical protein